MMVLVLLVGAASAAASAAAAAAAAAAFTASVPASGSSNKHGLDCDFESPCAWRWDAGGFVLASGATPLENGTAPATDASGNADGHYLLVQSRGGPPLEYLVRSPRTPSTMQRCRLHLWLHMLNMDDGHFKVVIEKDVSPAVIVIDKRGNSDNAWRRHEFTIGRVSEDFQLALEAVTANGMPSHLAIDNITVIDCFPEEAETTCLSVHAFQCEEDGRCIDYDHVCDLQEDCDNGEDEQQPCWDLDKVPARSRCSFEGEDGWCGWENAPNAHLNWTLHNGSSSKDITGPDHDHTYGNVSGHYMYANMSNAKQFADAAVLESAIFYPPPPYHANPTSPYFGTCKVRFHFHQFGPHSGSLELYATEMDKKQSARILSRTFGDHGDQWWRIVAQLPNITERYRFRFEAKRGYSPRGDVAIDDFSMSPECFGLGVPQNETGNYRYNISYWEARRRPSTEPHPSFINATYYVLTTCNKRGPEGPTQEDCNFAYSTDETKVTVHTGAKAGIQEWIVPEAGYYTIIAKGASGGSGSDAYGASYSAIARTIIELDKGQRIYVLVGQEGTGACKFTGYSNDYACQRNYTTSRPSGGAIFGLKTFEPMNRSGGGGGGGTFVFLLRNGTEGRPVLIAAGGGGLGRESSGTQGRQHGHGINLSRKAFSGKEHNTTTAGAGGGWRNHTDTGNPFTGRSLIHGGRGGRGCSHVYINEGSGGFGGGGSGCRAGGGGGGFAGGDVWDNETIDGEGGYSIIGDGIMGKVEEGAHDGPGQVIIIPAVSGCNCNYRCIALDEHRHNVRCICPDNWAVAADNISCVLVPDITSDWTSIAYVVFLVGSILMAFVSLGMLCIFMYNRYQKRKEAVMRQQVLSGPDLQLNRLREASDSLMTEYNPNYEFGGGTYTVNDLKDIPRDHLRLIKALGQGAFGEVYQGFYKHRSGDAVEMPVAVKTLPELSTSQAETDFLMEALIMSKFNHPNIVHFIGVCFDKHPRFIVLELLAGGDLKTFLRESRPKPERPSPLTMKDLLSCAIDVAKGCKYMEDLRFIHRDIAARNCLLTTKGPGRVVKIADFGMARDIYSSKSRDQNYVNQEKNLDVMADYYRKGGKAMLPIKWMPPEAFLDGIFTSKTDIWSFGVLLWEVMSLGYMPYTGCANREVMQLVTSGGRLEPPSNCPAPVYGIMTQCWHPNPDERPNFATILERLGYVAQDPDVVNAPLPVFNRPPSAERDITVMRPPAHENSCLLLQRAADYLNHQDTEIQPHAQNGSHFVPIA
ncbi:leukocyte tyrosine kinase receptor isoform X3 [Schistocerca americana]|uniref:leukocyte tyrosine kinase receptor isoform X3 n=1 Tax=Schistocerca americana TaxID=7009 RepID=UPI001F500E70|nr:leukocyte tyrosine kinase receptor isoform X3 [Schistocerca americana]